MEQEPKEIEDQNLFDYIFKLFYSLFWPVAASLDWAYCIGLLAGGSCLVKILIFVELGVILLVQKSIISFIGTAGVPVFYLVVATLEFVTELSGRVQPKFKQVTYTNEEGERIIIVVNTPSLGSLILHIVSIAQRANLLALIYYGIIKIGGL